MERPEHGTSDGIGHNCRASGASFTADSDKFPGGFAGGVDSGCFCGGFDGVGGINGS